MNDVTCKNGFIINCKSANKRQTGTKTIKVKMSLADYRNELDLLGISDEKEISLIS